MPFWLFRELRCFLSAALLLRSPSKRRSTPARQHASTLQGPGAGLEEIVVTAQRRSENLQRVPVAVTALSSGTLDDLRVTSAKDLSGLSPSLSISNQGLTSVPVIVIRGIASGQSNNAVDPKIGIYVDGVYIGRSIGSLFDLADLEQVEVLRGPQGTLFGRNATGGAISVVTKKPLGTFAVDGTVSYGNFNAMRGKLSVDLPALGPFTARFSYLHDEIDGYARNLIAGNTIDLSSRDPAFGTLRFAKRLGVRNVDAGQVAVHGDFGAVTADYRFDYTDARNVGRPMQSFGVPNDATGAIVDVVQALQPLLGGNANNSPTRLGAVANATSRERVVTQGHSLTLTANDSDNDIVAKSITAYRKFRQEPNVFDLSASGGMRFSLGQLRDLLLNNGANLLDPALAPGPDDAFYTLLSPRSTSQKQFSQEMQIQVTKSAFDLTAGLFFFHENSPATDILGILQPTDGGVVIANAGLLPGFPAGAALPFDYNQDGIIDGSDVNPSLDSLFGSGVTRTRAINNSYAGYAQLTLHVTPTVDITGGARYTIDDRETRISSISGGQGGQLGIGTYKISYKKLTYTGIVTWRPSDLVTTYAKIATGYVSGGIQSGIAYRPESLTTYELGFKSQFLDNRLRTNLALYYSQYKDVQSPNFTNGVAFFDNAGKADVKGFELEVEAAPVRGLTLSGNLSYTDFNYKRYLTGGVDITDIARLVYSPKWQARAAMQYASEPFANGSHIYARLDGNYRSKIALVLTPYLDASGAPLPLEDYAEPGGVFLLNGRLGLADIPMAGSAVTISAFGQNLTNRRFVDYGANVLRLVGTYDRGRTYGVELGFKF